MTQTIPGSTTAFMDYGPDREPTVGRHAYHLDKFDLTIISSPIPDYRAGASFPLLDFMITLADGLWPQDMVVNMSGRVLTVKGAPGEVIDETGQVWRPSGFKLARVKARKQ